MATLLCIQHLHQHFEFVVVCAVVYRFHHINIRWFL